MHRSTRNQRIATESTYPGGEPCSFLFYLAASQSLTWPKRLLAQGMDELLPQNLVQCFSLCELINELVQVANLLHERVLNFLHSNAAHHAFDKRDIGIDLWRLG